jgi:peptidoglycan/xylan/chitin deacetylase (PgdA/CDA1 family)
VEELVVRYLLCPPFPVVRFVSILPPFWGARLYANVNDRVLALTLDDGPDPKLTRRVLKMLEDRGARATFFLLGEAAAENRESRETVDAIVAAGHEIANHTLRDVRSSKLPKQELLAALAETHRILTDDRTAPVKLFRPGGGVPGWTGHVTRIARRSPQHYPTVLASIYPHDVRIRDKDVIVRGVLRRARRGAIIALHEGATPPKQPDRTRIVEMLDEILRDLQARSFEVVTASELFARAER